MEIGWFKRLGFDLNDCDMMAHTEAVGQDGMDKHPDRPSYGDIDKG